MGISIDILSMDNLHLIEPLWEKLNALHHEKSTHFKNHFVRQTFEERSAKWRGLPEECVYIGAAREKENGSIVAYCVCSVQGESGELDSIYVEPEYRGQNIGRKLAANGLAWLKQRGCRYIDVLVAEGNETALPFYEKLGFGVRGTVLRMK
jgi:ribosomal protein S18 acetylase RimI-like enzyme